MPSVIDQPVKARSRAAVRAAAAAQVVEAAPQVAKTGQRKISMNLPESDLDALRNWADEENTSVSDLIRRALMLLRYLSREQAKGSTVVIQTAAGEKDQVLRPLRQSSGLTVDAQV